MDKTNSVFLYMYTLNKTIYLRSRVTVHGKGNIFGIYCICWRILNELCKGMYKPRLFAQSLHYLDLRYREHV